MDRQPIERSVRPAFGPRPLQPILLTPEQVDDSEEEVTGKCVL